MATAVIGKWGNTHAVRIPKLICDEVGLRTKDEVSRMNSANQALKKGQNND